MVLTFFFVFLAYFLVDALFVVYMKEVEKNHPLRAGVTAALMYVFYAYGVVSYTKDSIFIIAIAAGSFLGTALVVYWQNRKKPDAIPASDIRKT
jgi:peptidoglycan biosynthesis protein MviN/MurJ (putative lipid II flippase)